MKTSTFKVCMYSEYMLYVSIVAIDCGRHGDAKCLKHEHNSIIVSLSVLDLFGLFWL